MQHSVQFQKAGWKNSEPNCSCSMNWAWAGNLRIFCYRTFICSSCRLQFQNSWSELHQSVLNRFSRWDACSWWVWKVISRVKMTWLPVEGSNLFHCCRTQDLNESYAGFEHIFSKTVSNKAVKRGQYSRARKSVMWSCVMCCDGVVHLQLFNCLTNRLLRTTGRAWLLRGGCSIFLSWSLLSHLHLPVCHNK